MDFRPYAAVYLLALFFMLKYLLGDDFVEKDIVYFSSKIRSFFYSLGSTLFVTGGIFILVYDFNLNFFNNLRINIIAIAIILFFGVAIVYWFPRIFKKKEILLVNKYGFKNSSTLINSGFVSWEDVLEIVIIGKSVGHYFSVPICSNYISVNLIDNKAYIKSTTGLLKLFSIFSKLILRYPINIPVQYLSGKHKEILETMKKYHTEFQSK